MSNVIELNPNKQYIICGDISASMNQLDSKCAGQSRFDYMIEKFRSFIVEASDFDPDGPTIILFGEDVKVFPNTTIDKVESSLISVQFEGFTNTHMALEAAWNQHKAEKSELSKEGKAHSGTVVFIFTDGEPTNRAALERKITEIANAVDRDDEFSIGFILVGTVPQELRSYLHKLDDELNVKYDIVGISEIEGLSFLKAVNNAINE